MYSHVCKQNFFIKKGGVVIAPPCVRSMNVFSNKPQYSAVYNPAPRCTLVVSIRVKILQIWRRGWDERNPKLVFRVDYDVYRPTEMFLRTISGV